MVSTDVAAVAALLWCLHPLQTESVTYVIQRAESLMGLWFLLTFYAVVRSIHSSRPWRWQTLAVVACALGAGTKEVIATAPLLVLLYDRSFVSGSFRAAWRERRGLYVGLSLTWVILALLVASTGGDRGGTFALTPHIALTYWASQTQAIADYIRLSFWPHPLVFERGLPQVPAPGRLAALIVFVSLLVGGTAVALWKTPRVGFFGAWFLLILSPTSILPGTIQSTVEHRMYLSLAAIVVGVVCLCAARGGRKALGVVMILIPIAAFATYRRNDVYRDELTLWLETRANSPRSAIAEGNVGLALFNRGKIEEAVSHYERALQIDPTPPNSHYNLGLTYRALGRSEDALREFAACVRLNPRHYPAYYEAGRLLRNLGRPADAEEQFRLALRQKPDVPQVYQELGLLAMDTGDWAKAKAAFSEAWRLDPASVAAVANLGAAEYHLGDLAGAAQHLEYAIHTNPSLAEAHVSLGQVRLGQGDATAARSEFETALAIDPGSAAAHLNLGLLFAQRGEVDKALPHFEAAVKRAPGRAETHGNYANALVEAGNLTAALAEYEASLKIDSTRARVHANYGNALLRVERLPEALVEFSTAVKLDPTDTASAEIVERLQAYLAHPTR